ncbi:peptidase M16 family protein [Paraliomyxa miuraensis]|uniref:hypothetical protein n=1 Tax=Paraliomyxa miuraensis TaxID=376150 RepID=UPI002256BD5A|nr:hypothetical protein [Paraliomyxa miuraensis]MCX4243503.1 hypothetical protein [Paraliomyxa miuraensis]
MLLLAALSCKRQLAPKVEEVWDEPPTVGQSEALASLAPPWPAPTRAVLDSGLVTFWLHEPAAPVTHLRVLLPVGDEPALRSASVVAVLQTHLAIALGSRTRNRGVVVQTHAAPDRVELVAHAPIEETARTLELLAGVLGARSPAAGLETARAEVLTTIASRPSTDELAISTLVEQLLGRDPGSQRTERSEVEALSRDALLEGWEALVDPRRAVLVVHASDDAAAHRPALRQLAERWRGLGRRPVPPSALARLRAAPPPAASSTAATSGAAGGRLLATPASPLHVLPGQEGKAVLVFGRVVPTPTPQDRSLARLAQRVLQEELDVRLQIHGDVALFVVRVSLSGREPERSATEAVDALTSLAATRQPQQRLFQAAQLWLGARVVQASLDGEDWTALWSEALDLADRDEDVAGALAHDAGSMLEPDADALQAWLQRWLDPRGGEPGWRWLVAGASDRELRRLTRITPLDESGSTPPPP